MILGKKFKIGKKTSFSLISPICLTSEVHQAVQQPKIIYRILYFYISLVQGTNKSSLKFRPNCKIKFFGPMSQQLVSMAQSVTVTKFRRPITITSTSTILMIIRLHRRSRARFPRSTHCQRPFKPMTNYVATAAWALARKEKAVFKNSAKMTEFCGFS